MFGAPAGCEQECFDFLAGYEPESLSSEDFSAPEIPCQESLGLFDRFDSRGSDESAMTSIPAHCGIQTPGASSHDQEAFHSMLLEPLWPRTRCKTVCCSKYPVKMIRCNGGCFLSAGSG